MRERYEGLPFKVRTKRDELIEVNPQLKIDLEKEGKKRRAEKMGHYAKQVKEMYWPKVSKKKQLEIEQLREGFR